MSRFREPAASDAIAGSTSRAPSKNLKVLQHLVKYISRYRIMVLGAMLAVVVASSAVLTFGYGLKRIVDEGFASQNTGSLDTAFTFMLGVIITLAFAGFARLYLVTRLGENVIADIRRDLFAHLLRLPPSFYETARTGEILSRLTADTGLIQTIIATSLPIALRNGISLLGAVILLFAASPKLTGSVLIIVPLVIRSFYLVVTCGVSRGSPKTKSQPAPLLRMKF